MPKTEETPVEIPVDATDKLKWTKYFRQYEPAVAEFVDHLEAFGGKISDEELVRLLLPAMKRLMYGHSLRAGAYGHKP